MLLLPKNDISIPEGSAIETTTEVRVRYGETDQMGVVYYASYLDWFTEGRTDVLRQRGLSYRSWEAEGVYLPVTEVNCRYVSPARYDDLLYIRTKVHHVTPVQIRFDYRIVRENQLLAEGYTCHAYVGRDGKAMNIRKKHPHIWAWLLEACKGSPSTKAEI